MALTAQPYLTFPGTAREAMTFYHDLFGGDLTVSTFGEFHSVEEGHPSYDKVMHADLRGGAVELKASDDTGMEPGQVVYGNNVDIALFGDDEAEIRRFWESLSEGARSITMPFEQQVWGDLYGALVDRFGTGWQLDVTSPEYLQ